MRAEQGRPERNRHRVDPVPLLVTHPVASALPWTLLFASFFTVIGVFRLVAAIMLKFPNWGWADLRCFGCAFLWIDWPRSELWFLGLAVGVSLPVRVWSYIMFPMTVRTLPAAVVIRQGV